jgi:hypothetical protein
MPHKLGDLSPHHKGADRMPGNGRGIADASTRTSGSARLGRRKSSRASTCADPPGSSRQQPVPLVESALQSAYSPTTAYDYKPPVG